MEVPIRHLAGIQKRNLTAPNDLGPESIAGLDEPSLPTASSEVEAILACFPDSSLVIFDRKLHLLWSSGKHLENVGILGAIPPSISDRCRAAISGESSRFQVVGNAPVPGTYVLDVRPIGIRAERIQRGLILITELSKDDPMVPDPEILADNSTDVICVTDQSGVIQYASNGSGALWGCEPAELIGRSIHEFLQPHQSSEISQTGGGVLLIPGGASLTHSATPRDYIWLDSLVRQEGEIGSRLPRARSLTGMTAGGPDSISADGEAFRRSFEQAPSGMALFNLGHGDTGGLVRVNIALASMLGYQSEDLRGRTLRAITHPQDTPVDRDLAEQLRTGSVQPSHRELRLLRSDGEIIWARVSLSVVWDEDGTPLHGIAQFDDISERKRTEDRLSQLALHDPVTGLANRLLLMDRIALALERARRGRRLVALAYIDLDGFKHTNDSLGHEAGDLLLRAVARRLQRMVRPSDTAARIGGDEFVLLSEDAGDEYLMLNLGERFQAAIQAPFAISGQEIVVSASIGIAFAAPDDVAETLLRNGTQAMYWAKENGRSRCEIFDKALRARASEYLTVETGLRRALDHGELRVFYQPVLNVKSGNMVGVEALVRWQHPERGLLLPGEFLDVAQESRLITGVSAVVLREACQQAAHWHREGWPVGVSVNVSASEIGSSLFMTTLKRALADTGLPPPSLCLEVTESVLFQASDAGQNHIQELKEIGVKLALDDFGTAFASLDYVRRFPIDRIKIDHSFIAGITNNPRDQAIAAGIIALADAIPVEVVAEGIETAEHLDRIRTTGCRLAQGFYLGTPQPAELIGSLLGKPEGSASPSA